MIEHYQAREKHLAEVADHREKISSVQADVKAKDVEIGHLKALLAESKGECFDLK
jgi:hypothetical protein